MTATTVNKKRKKYAQKKKPSRTEAKKPKDTTQPAKGKYAYMNKVAYVIADKKFGELEVRKTSNGWWKDKEKLENIIVAKKIGGTDEISCYYGGIYKGDLDYFLKVHPHFLQFFKSLKESPKIKALTTMFNDLGNAETAKWYLERKMKDEFSKRSELTGRDGNAFMEKDLTEAEVRAAIAGAQAMLGDKASDPDA